MRVFELPDNIAEFSKEATDLYEDCVSAFASEARLKARRYRLHYRIFDHIDDEVAHIDAVNAEYRAKGPDYCADQVEENEMARLDILTSAGRYFDQLNATNAELAEGNFEAANTKAKQHFLENEAFYYNYAAMVAIQKGIDLNLGWYL